MYETLEDGFERPIACRIHDVYGEFQKSDHNCLGCNFADATNGALKQLERIAGDPGELEHDMVDYIMRLYLFVERAFRVFDIIDLPAAYRRRHFDSLVTIKRWANFFKHPTWFILVHHPSHFVEGDPSFKPDEYSAVIDSTFVRDNYGSDAKSKCGKVKALLQNKNDIAVLFPDPEQITNGFCDCVEQFVNLPAANSVYAEILGDLGTFEDYFSSPEEQQG
jgi:hypothetical protein